MDPKSIFASKTFWLNILAPLFAWAGTKYGLQFDAETQAAVVGGVLGAVNVVLRAVTHQPVTVSGSASPAIAVMILAGACSACTSAPPAANLATACDTLAAGYMTAASLRSAGKLTTGEVAVLTKLEPTALAACSKTNPPLDVAGALATVVAAAGSIAAITKGK